MGTLTDVVGVGASTPADGYVGDVFRHELTRIPGLQLVNFSCSGATTTTVLHGGGYTFTTGSQLGDAEQFLQAHRGQVALLTIDIGADNIDGCFSLSGIDASYVTTGEGHVATELPQIMSGLRNAYSGLRTYGMNYYDRTWRRGCSAREARRSPRSR